MKTEPERRRIEAELELTNSVRDQMTVYQLQGVEAEAGRTPGQMSMAVKGRMGYSGPPRSVAGVIRDPLMVSDAGLQWYITTMGSASANASGFIAWNTIYTWATRPRKYGRTELQVQHLLANGSYVKPALQKLAPASLAVLAFRGKPGDITNLTEIARQHLPTECKVTIL